MSGTHAGFGVELDVAEKSTLGLPVERRAAQSTIFPGDAVVFEGRRVPRREMLWKERGRLQHDVGCLEEGDVPNMSRPLAVLKIPGRVNTEVVSPLLPIQMDIPCS